jgi:DNA-directed RNA polymerase I subunit RPA43
VIPASSRRHTYTHAPPSHESDDPPHTLFLLIYAEGKVTLSSPDHVALLVHRTFNVSIPRHHLPSDEWAFEHGPAENDPEFGAGADAEDGAEAEGRADGAGENGETEDEGGVDTGGRWVSNSSGERLGDKGLVEFTVVG